MARTPGATPAQVIGGLCVAQLVPTLPGVLVGIPLGLALWWVLTIGTMVLPSVWWLLVATLAMLLGVAAFTALPARIEARRAVADVLRAETT